jgi:hypothetical protein
MSPANPSHPSEVLKLGNRVLAVRAITGRACTDEPAGFLLKNSQGEPIDVLLPDSASEYRWKNHEELALFVAQTTAMDSMLVAVKSPRDLNPVVFRDGIANCIPSVRLLTTVAPLVVSGLATGYATSAYPLLSAICIALIFAVTLRLFTRRLLLVNALCQAVRELALRAGYERRRDHALDTFAQSRARLERETEFENTKTSSSYNCRLHLMESDRPALPRSL